MPQEDDVRIGLQKGNGESGRANPLIICRNALFRVQKSKEEATTTFLVGRYGEEGQLPASELMRRCRMCREKAAGQRQEVRDSRSGTDASTRADLLKRAAHLERRAARYEEMIKKRTEPLLAAAVARMYPKGTRAYVEMREDLFQEASLRLSEVLGSGKRTFFEKNFLHALAGLIITSAKHVSSIYGRSQDGRRVMPEELDAPTGEAALSSHANQVTIGDTLEAPLESDPEYQASLSSVANQLREGVVAASSHQGQIAERKFEVACLRLAGFKQPEVRGIISARFLLKTYSIESENLDKRHGLDALGKAIRNAKGALDGVSQQDIIEALQAEGRLIASTCP